MKKTILILFVFLMSIAAKAEPVVKLYLNDGTNKQYKIADVMDMQFANVSENLLMTIYDKSANEDVYPVSSVTKLEFSKDSLSNDLLIAYIFNTPRNYTVNDLDSIVFEYLETKIQSNVTVIDSAKSVDLVAADSNKVIFNTNSETGKNLKAGDIIAGEPSENAPYGFLKRVISTTESGDSVIVITEDANLTDVVENGVISFERTFTPADTGTAQRFVKMNNNNNNPQISSTEFTVGFKDVVIYDPIKIDGTITFNPTVSFNLVISNWKVRQCLVKLSIKNTLELTAHSNFTIEKEFKTSLNELLNIPKINLPPITIPVGWVPVSITSNIDLQAGFKVKALDAELSAGIKDESSVYCGIEYNNGTWHSLSGADNEFSFVAPDVSLSSSIKAFVGPQLNINIYDLQNAFNAFANALNFVEFKANFTSAPCWQLSAGVEGNAGIESEWFGLDKELPLALEKRKILAQATDLITSVTPSEARPGDIITIKGSGFGEMQGASYVKFKFGNSLLPIDAYQATIYPKWTDKEIQVQVPEGLNPQNVELLLNVGGFLSNKYDMTILDLPNPTITVINPSFSEIDKTIMINGRDFGNTQGNGAVSFNTLSDRVNAEVVSWSNNLIKVKVPPTAYTGSVKVTTGRNKVSNEFEYGIAPTINTISSDKFKTGVELIINGSGFGTLLFNNSNYYLLLGDVKITEFAHWDNNQIKVIIPDNIESGALSVTASGLRSYDFNYTIIPNIATALPANVQVGSILTITGSGFGSMQGASFVSFGTKKATVYTEWTKNEIKVKVPSGISNWKVSVTVGAIQSNQLDFTVTPQITEIAPNTVRIGDELTITGTGFGEIQNSSTVTIGSVVATEIVSWSDELIKAKISAGAATGKVFVTVSNLKSNEKDIMISTLGNLESVTIGTQVWMKKNLDVTNYRNGDPIPQVTDPTQWADLTTGAWCYYNNDPAYGEIYGKLYNSYAVNDPRGLAPDGWHVPSEAEWTLLINFLGSNGGGKLKSIGTIEAGDGLWYSPNGGATNETGFSALPGGYRDYNGAYGYGDYGYIGGYGFWWSASEYPPNSAWFYVLYSIDGSGGVSANPKKMGLSVRCLRD